MKDYSKKIKHILDELSDKAYQRELEFMLSDLEKEFAKWREGEINCWDLVDLLHVFHDRDARDLYKQYTSSHDPAWNVAGAINDKILKKNEVPSEVLDAISNLLEMEKK